MRVLTTGTKTPRAFAPYSTATAARRAAWILAQGANQWRQPHVLQANPDLGMASRFCIPLFASGWLLGHMMVIDAHQSLTTEERTRIELTGAEIAAQLYADRLETDPGHLERQRKTQALLSEHEPTRLDATLYYRLDQIRKANGLDLDDGRNRLELHIGLHLLRLVLPSSISDR